MLAMSRGVDEGFRLILADGSEIHVVVIKFANGRVMLGIDAPQTVEISRDVFRNPAPTKRAS